MHSAVGQRCERTADTQRGTTPAEVKDGIYTLWDDDKDGFLEYHEFASNLDAAGLWSNWDVNDDSYVTITEVYYWNPHGKEENSSADSQNNSK